MYKFFRNLAFAALALVFFAGSLSAQQFAYSDAWNEQGYTVLQQDNNTMRVNFSIEQFNLSALDINGQEYLKTELPGVFLPNDEGYPDLAGMGRFIALPNGATAHINIINQRIETIENVEIAPAPRIPKVTDDGPLYYEKNQEVYATNAFYPAEPIKLSEQTEIRGINSVVLGVTPFQYNPVTKELRVIRDVEIEITFEGGDGQFGDIAYRNPMWDHILTDMFINQEMLPTVDYAARATQTRNSGEYEYVIIIPDNPVYQQWADSLKRFRNQQGILTGVVKVTDIGGNTVGAIESYVNDAYQNWVTKPVAFLLIGDYGTSGDNCIVSPIWDGYCVSDNIYADVNADELPDVVFARMTAQNADHLETMVTKVLNYERNPSTNSDFYNNPITACGWQTERWFQICAETVGGFWKNELGKEPVRINEIYSGSPGSSWSTATNTATVVDYFGPNGLGYIPASPSTLGNWSGGNSSDINNAINSGAFMLVHRDHGMETGWGEPSYTNSNLSGLNNDDLPFVFSINCLTGKYNWSGECFAEAFHRHEKGCVGIMAASEVSYSFVNDTYVWGMMDNMWPDFDPGYGGNDFDMNFIRPAFANAAGKIYLHASNWPYNTNNKPVTYHLFHNHGDAYLSVYSEMPQTLNVQHAGLLPAGVNSYQVQAPSGAQICLSLNGEIIGRGFGAGGPVTINIEPQQPGNNVLLTVTKQNYYRYQESLLVAGAPAQAESPQPANNKIGVAPFTVFSWADGYGTPSNTYKFYLGTNNPPTNLVNGEVTTENVFTLDNELDYETEYFWKIVSTNDYGTTEGEVWSFTTNRAPDEDFESGSFNSFPWELEGDANWTIVQDEVFHGTHSAQSGDVAAGQVSSLKISMNINTFMSTINFYKMVTSEPGSVLEFYIDGNLKDSWTGLSGWSAESFNVVTGNHIFEWRFINNGKGGRSENAAWIDYIYFPTNGGIIASAGQDASICEGSTHQLMGNATNADAILWSSAGDGTFNDASIMDPVYTPGTQDIEDGSVVLTLTASSAKNDVSDDMTLTINKTPIAETGETAVVCAGEDLQVAGNYENYESLFWSTDGDGTFDNATFEFPVYTPGTEDIANGTVTLSVEAMAWAPCENVSADLVVTIHDVPAAPESPAGPEVILINEFTTSDYTVTEVAGAVSYSWEIAPAEAGTIEGEATTGTVSWNTDYQGDAFIAVKAMNECGESERSVEFAVEVSNSVGINELLEGNVGIFPNPTNGSFSLNINANAENLRIRIVNTVGVEVYNESNIKVNGTFTRDFELENLEEGMYLMIIENGQSNIIKKVIVEK